MIVGNGRGYLCSDRYWKIVNAVRGSGRAGRGRIRNFPHYKQVRAFMWGREPFSIENGMLTANGKLKRDLISSRMKSEIENMYQVKQAV